MPTNNHHHLDASDVEKVTKKSDYEKQMKAKKTRKIIYITICSLIGVVYVFFLIAGRYIFDPNSEAYQFYQSFDIFAKSNPQGFMRLLSYALLVFTAGFIVRMVLDGIIARKKAKKKSGIALLEMLGNFVKYVTYIILFCLVLSAFGIDASAIFAGLGILTLIIGLGVTSLIEDIVAGIFIIIEHLFDVGDIIVLDGFRGTVVSIGIRSTKIADVGNDVLVIRNSSIGAFVNLTTNQSSAAITIPLAPGESIEKVDEIMKNAHIEDWQKLNQNILGAPLYLGICEVTPKGVQNLLFVAGCKEENKYEVQRVLYHEVKVLLEKNGVKLGISDLLEEKQED